MTAHTSACLLAAATFVSATLGLMALAIVRRSRAYGRWLEIAATLAPIGALACVGIGLHRTRTAILSVTLGAGPVDQKTALLSQSITDDVTLRWLGAPLVLVALVASALGAGVAVAARTRSRMLMTVGVPLAFVVLGFGPLATATFAGANHSAPGWAAVSTVPLDQKTAHAARLLDTEAHLLRLGFIASAAGCGLAGALGLALGRKVRDTVTPEPARSISWAGPVLLLAIAAGATALSVPLRQENAVPWPPPWNGEKLLLEMETPVLEGPDAVERAPVLIVSREARPGGLPELRQRLEAVRNEFQRQQPDHDFGSVVVLVATPDAPSSRVGETLTAAWQIGYREALLTFIRNEIHQRPHLGRLKRNHTTAARVQFAAPGAASAPGLVVLRVTGGEPYGKLAARAVEARRRGDAVVLQLR
jgi:hypothetical protein